MKISQFQNKLQELETTAISSDFLKNMVDSGTSLLDVLGKLISGFGELSTAFGNISGIGGTLGAISGVLMNRAGVGERTVLWRMYCAHPIKVA